MKIENHMIFDMWAGHPPAARVESGGSVTFATRDCFSNQLEDKDEKASLKDIDLNQLNPAAGTVFVEGTMQRILQIR